MLDQKKIAVIIPCYKSDGRVIDVVRKIPKLVDFIIVVDDACPEKSANLLEAEISDPRLVCLRLPNNLGVGGATKAGWLEAAKQGADILVKLDADGQMDPALIQKIVSPLVNGVADYAKGNRFFNPVSLSSMPSFRLLGNAILSFMTKLSSGYWSVFDPTNGFVAIHASLLPLLELNRIDDRYFFESDVLFRLSLARAVVADVPMKAKYDGEPSHLRPLIASPAFVYKNMRNFFKRIVYAYFLRDFRPASLNLLVGVPLFVGGGVFGLTLWLRNHANDQLTSAGQVMLAALPIILGAQMILAAITEDIYNQPSQPIFPSLSD